MKYYFPIKNKNQNNCSIKLYFVDLLKRKSSRAFIMFQNDIIKIRSKNWNQKKCKNSFVIMILMIRIRKIKFEISE
jgi:hypothetical protein